MDGKYHTNAMFIKVTKEKHGSWSMESINKPKVDGFDSLNS